MNMQPATQMDNSAVKDALIASMGQTIEAMQKLLTKSEMIEAELRARLETTGQRLQDYETRGAAQMPFIAGEGDSALLAQIQAAKNVEGKLRAQLRELQSKAATDAQKLSEARQTIDALTKEKDGIIQAATTNAQVLQGTLRDAQQKEKELASEIEKLKSRMATKIGSLQEKLDQAEQQMEELRSKAATDAQKLREAQQQIEELHSKAADTAATRKQTTPSSKELNAKEKENKELRLKLDDALNQESDLAKQVKSLTGEKEELSVQLKEALNRESEHLQANSTLEQKNKELLKRMNELISDNRSLQSISTLDDLLTHAVAKLEKKPGIRVALKMNKKPDEDIWTTGIFEVEYEQGKKSHWECLLFNDSGTVRLRRINWSETALYASSKYNLLGFKLRTKVILFPKGHAFAVPLMPYEKLMVHHPKTVDLLAEFSVCEG